MPLQGHVVLGILVSISCLIWLHTDACQMVLSRDGCMLLLVEKSDFHNEDTKYMISVWATAVITVKTSPSFAWSWQNLSTSQYMNDQWSWSLTCSNKMFIRGKKIDLHFYLQLSLWTLLPPAGGFMYYQLEGVWPYRFRAIRSKTCGLSPVMSFSSLNLQSHFFPFISGYIFIYVL